MHGPTCIFWANLATFSLQDWHLVRRDAGSADPTGDECWHPAEDNLRGVDVYGENDHDPLGVHTVRARPGRLSAISVFLCKSVFYGAFVWARRALNRQKRRFPARAVLAQVRRPAVDQGAKDAKLAQKLGQL